MHAGKKKLAVLFERIGPYHDARLKALTKYFDVTCIEMSRMDQTYQWDLVTKIQSYKKVTLFSDGNYRFEPTDVLEKNVFEAFDKLQPSFVSVVGWYERSSLTALDWCSRKNIPCVLMTESTEQDFKRWAFPEFLKRQIIPFFPSSAVGGTQSKKYVQKLGMNPAFIQVGYDAVDNHYFRKGAEVARKNAASLRRRLGLPRDYFLVSSRFIKKKNLPFLIESYAQYRQKSPKPWDLVLMGDGVMRAELVALIGRLGLAGCVKMPGFIQYGQLPTYYGLAKAFILASTSEQWGLVVNEAEASGLPVLVSDNCGCAADLVQNGKNGFTFNPSRPEELSSLMLRMADGGVDLKAMSRHSLALIQNWSPERFAEGMKAACAQAESRPQHKAGFLNRLILRMIIRRPNLIERFWNSSVKTGTIKTGPRKVLSEAQKPNFFIIGAPKSGTTALVNYLKSHPNIYVSPTKEPDYFDFDLAKTIKMSEANYLSLFFDADPAVHKAILEASTNYLFSKRAVYEILKFNPLAKFIVMLRNPVDMIYSWHSEMVYQGTEDVFDFELAWRLQSERRKGGNIPFFCYEPKKLMYSDWGKSGEQLERLFKTVDRKRVKVILFDDFIKDTKRVYGEVLSFLNVSSDGKTDFPPVNENKMVLIPSLHPVFSLLVYLSFLFHKEFKLKKGFGLLEKVMKLNSGSKKRAPLPEEFKNELKYYFRKDVSKLSKLLKRDLAKWTA